MATRPDRGGHDRARLRLVLDQSVPTPVVNGLGRFLPEVELVPLRRIDNRLSALDDRELVLALYQLGWTGLVTTSARMLRVPDLLAALLRTGVTLLVVEDVEDDPLSAVGALLLGLPTVRRWLAGATRGKPPEVFRLGPRKPGRVKVLDLLTEVAHRQDRDVRDLYGEVAVSEDELNMPVLAPRFGGA